MPAVELREALAQLRPHLGSPTADHAGGRAGGGPQRGSLRWLEAELGRRGGRAGAARNIVYRGLGTPEDKRLLTQIVGELAQEAGLDLGLDLGTESAPAPLPAELELLGREKKRVYKQFLAGVRAGKAPQMAVWGRAGAGKNVLLDHLAVALAAQGQGVTRLNLSGDVLALGVLPTLPPPPERSYAALAEWQARSLEAAWPAAGAALLRVTGDLNFGGEAPRGRSGEPLTPGAWVAEQLAALPRRSTLITLESPEGWPGEPTELRPPTLSEARDYLMSRLGLGRVQASALARETGRNLDHLALLAGVGSDPARLLEDPGLRRVAAAVRALSEALPHPPGRRGGAEWRGRLPGAPLSAALGLRLGQLPPHARSLLGVTQESEPGGESGEGLDVSPGLRAAAAQLPEAEWKEAARRLLAALDSPGQALQGEAGRWRTGALCALGEWGALARRLREVPDEARYLPEYWPQVRAGARGSERDELARAVVSHHAGRGEYHEGSARDALFTLLESPERAARLWARVKLAESSVDAGQFAAASEQLRTEVGALLGRPAYGGWELAAQADALLVQAALLRWQGDTAGAARVVADPRTAQSGPRAQLWRGLIAKDAGAWDEALRFLSAVPQGSPLLAARAEYQAGDLQLRLGQPGVAQRRLLRAAEGLAAAGASAEECARALSRAATAERRLGHLGQALALSQRALALLPPEDASRRLPHDRDRVPRARLLSEQLPVLLALGRCDEALWQAAQVLGLLGAAQTRRPEAAYRIRRTQYRAALAYLTRGSAKPYSPPFWGNPGDSADLATARALLRELLAGAAAGDSDREQLLTFDMRLSLALASGPDGALEELGRALDMTDHPYAEAQARALLADTRLRRGEDNLALSELHRAHALVRRLQGGRAGAGAGGAGIEAEEDPGDPGLLASLHGLEARIMLREAGSVREAAQALHWLRHTVDTPALRPFQGNLWRELGRSLEAGPLPAEEVLRGAFPEAPFPLSPLPLRPADALWVLAAESRSAGARQGTD